MKDTLPTVWTAARHTLAKHAILERYLKAWFPILSWQAANDNSARRSEEILFIDGFAGPGEYENGKPGSPIIAMKAALDHSVNFPIPIRMVFVEQRDDRYRNLERVLSPLIESSVGHSNVKVVEPQHGDCDAVVNQLLDRYEYKDIRFGPALAFLDQFGYGAVSMELVSRILLYPQCEVFTYLDYKDMNRWMSDPHKKSAMDKAFGGSEWQNCLALPEQERKAKLLELYKNALRTRGGAQYVVSFIMYDKDTRPLYWLLFCTNSLRGLEEMKKAMWSVDKTGNFRFSDRDQPDQLELLDVSYNQTWLAEELKSRLSGRTMSVADVKEFVLTDTPCYLFKSDQIGHGEFFAQLGLDLPNERYQF